MIRSRFLTNKKNEDQDIDYYYDSLGALKTVIYRRDMDHEKDCNKVFWRKHRHQRKDYRIDYIVDGQGRRVAKKVNGKLTQMFVYQSQLQIAAELDGFGRLVKQFVYGTKPNIPDYMIMGGKTYAIASDHLGSPRAVVETASGKVIARMAYDEFGNLERGSDDDILPFGFAGGLYDSDTKLVRFGARDYDPEIGRWTSKDPIRFSGGDTNLYGYILADPINFIDSEGTVPSMPNIDPSDGATPGSPLQCGAAEPIYPVESIVIPYLGFRALAAEGFAIWIRQYPNSGGGGIGLSQNGRNVIRIDVHPIRPGGPHMPHVDSPTLGLKHWPWR